MNEDLRLQKRIEGLLSAISSLRPQIEQKSRAFREDYHSSAADLDKWSDRDWCRIAFGDAMVRLRQLTEKNFRFIETMGFLCLAWDQ